jgi:hypothetical protein
VVRKEFHEIGGEKTINIGVCTWNIGQTYGRTNIGRSLMGLLRRNKVARYTINFD